MERLTIDIDRHEMPADFHGASAWINGRFVVLLNANESEAEQERAFVHEMLHIYRGDHFSTASAEEVEARADAFFASL